MIEVKIMQAVLPIIVRNTPPVGNSCSTVALEIAEAVAPLIQQAEDAMRERIGMLEKLLSDCSDELAAEVEARFERVWGHPAMQHKIKRDMSTVVAARAAIRGIDAGGEE